MSGQRSRVGETDPAEDGVSHEYRYARRETVGCWTLPFPLRGSLARRGDGGEGEKVPRDHVTRRLTLPLSPSNGERGEE